MVSFLPWKCHIHWMAIIKLFESVTRPRAGNLPADTSDQVESRHSARPATTADAKDDTWIDELQWLAGFPTGWGERRSW